MTTLTRRIRPSRAKYPPCPKVCVVCKNHYSGKSWPGFLHMGGTVGVRPSVCSMTCYERQRHADEISARNALNMRRDGVGNTLR